MKVGWIGLGNMGHPMDRNLLKARHEMVVYNRTRSRADSLEAEGASVAALPAQAATAPILVTMVADDPALEDLIFGAGKVMENLARGATHISMSTISVSLSRRMAEAHAKAGHAYVSAPVFGRPEAAAAAKLFIVAAGPGKAVGEC